MSDDDRGALTKRLLPDGVEPDPRFTLANERTFLAWVRTALAFIAGGIAVEAFTGDLFPTAIRQILAFLLLVLGMLLAGGAAVRWLNVERAMRRKNPLPVPHIVPNVSHVSAVAAGALALVIANL